jgi:hypothetical protein
MPRRDHEERCRRIAKAFENPGKLAFDISAKVADLIPTPETHS